MRMSRRFRHRVMAVTLGGLVLGAPLLSGAADAGVVQSGRQVTFRGGAWPAFTCRSSPDVESITVPATGTVTIANRTGHDARLVLDGVDRGLLRADSATAVRFPRGATTVAVDPNCALDNDVAAATVTTDTPSPADSGSAGPGAIPGGDPATAQEPSVDSGPVGPAPDAPAGAAPRGPASNNQRGSVRRTVPRRPGPVAGHKQARRPGASVPKIKVKTGRRTAGVGPLPATVTPSGQVTAPGVPKRVVPPVPPAPAVTSPQVAPAGSAEPVAAARPLPPERPIGLLALVAAVCAVGVGVAAIRAFVAERASRAGIT
jgi:hypothetical protein